MGGAGIAVLPGVVEVLRAGCTDRGYVDGLGRYWEYSSSLSRCKCTRRGLGGGLEITHESITD